MPIEDTLMDLDLGPLKEGDIFQNRDEEDFDHKLNATMIDAAREILYKVKEMYDIGKKPTKKEFNDMIKKLEDKRSVELDHFLDQLQEEDDFLKLTKRTKLKNGKIVMEFEPINKDDRIKLIRSITDKLIKKLKPEQLRSLLEEGVRKTCRNEKLEKIDKALDDGDVKIKERKGCFRLFVNEEEVLMLT